jgi:hypothetical protein
LLLCCYKDATAQVSYYELVARHSGKCLDVNSASLAAGAQVWQWDCNATHAQQWQLIEVGGGYKKIVARHSGKVLDVANAGLNNGDIVWQWDENGTPAQQWQFTGTGDGYYKITVRHSGKALEVSGNSTASGTQVAQWDYTGGANQQWQLRPVAAPFTYYEISARHSGKCLDVNSASTENGVQLWQWECNGGFAQQWQIADLGDGYYKIVARHSGKTLDVAGASIDNGAPVVQWDFSGGTNQQWQLIDVGGGYYKIIARHSGKALDVAGGFMETGTQVFQWEQLGGSNQQWLLRPVTWGSKAKGRTGHWADVAGWPQFVAVHAHLLPNGKVLAWAGENVAAPSHHTQVHLWDPAAGTFQRVDNTTTDLFCSGHSFLPDGRLLVAGGHHHYDGPNQDQPVGEPHASIFDYRYNTWSKGPDMGAGRWYPTNTTLASGEVLVVSGAVDGYANVNQTPEVWQTTGTWRALTGALRVQPLYPWMHVAPNGLVFNSGPNQNTDYLNTSGGGFWSALTGTLFGRERSAGTSVMYAPGKVAILGGGDPPTNTAEVIDLNVGSPAWRLANPMIHARRQVNSTLLPDGMVLVTGGTSFGGFNNEAGAVLSPEMWDPATGWWATIGPMRVPRLYHSVALLLPDGRVLSAGGGNGGGTDYPDAEVYSPPYLFKGLRPTIRSVSSRVGYGQRFFIWTSEAASVARVTLIRLSSVTHSYNQNQRFNDLTATLERSTGGVYVRAPASRSECPPGHYMLFILNGAGVPSVARIIQVQ